MKKILAILLAMMLVLSMGVVAFADEAPVTPALTTTTANMGKVVAISGTNAKMPAQTFTFAITNAGVTDAASTVTTATMPTPTLGSVSYSEGESGEKAIPITLPTYTSVGVYTYTITENAGDTLGMTYATGSLTLKVTVVNDENGGVKVAGTSLVGSDDKKHDTFTNKYEAGSLTIKKIVTGNLGVKSQKFDIDVTFTSSKPVASTISGVAINTNDWTLSNSTYTCTKTVSLADNETATFYNIPYGVSYTVAEDEKHTNPDDAVGSDKGYTVSYDDNKTQTIAASTYSTTVTNNKGTTPDTGITTDSLPYIMLLGFVVLAGAAMLIKRRAARHN